MIEQGNWITELDPANPPDKDVAVEGPAQFRLIKARLISTFPNIKGQVTASHDDLNSPLLQTRTTYGQATVPIYGGDGTGVTIPITPFGQLLLSLTGQDQMVQDINCFVATTGSVMSGGLVVPEVVLNQSGTFALQSPEGFATIQFPDGFYIQHGTRGTLVFGAAGTQVAEIDGGGNFNIRGKVTENYGF